MWIILYNLSLILVALLGSPVFVFYLIKKKKNFNYLLTVLGFSQPLLPPYPLEKGGRIMIHCVSMGETLAVKSLVESIKERFPEAQLVMTVTTKTGFKTAKKQYSSRGVEITYFPWDFFFSVRRFMKRVKPNLIIIAETELWPGLFYSAGKYSIPVFLVNARLSEKSARIHGKLYFFWKNFIPAIQSVCAQSHEESSRFERIGIQDSRVYDTGNLKFDNPGILLSDNDKNHLRKELILNEDDFVVILGSTHGGEEKMLLDELVPLIKQSPRLKLLVVPRHLERVPEIESYFKEKKWNYSLRSGSNNNTPSYIILINTLGELVNMYNISNVAIIGGTFVPVGGHNIFEAAAAGCYPVFGPHMFKQKPMLNLALETGGGYSCETPEKVKEFIQRCLDNKFFLQQMIQKSQYMVSLKKGAVKKTLDVIQKKSYLSEIEV